MIIYVKIFCILIDKFGDRFYEDSCYGMWCLVGLCVMYGFRYFFFWGWGIIVFVGRGGGVWDFFLVNLLCEFYKFL